MNFDRLRAAVVLVSLALGACAGTTSDEDSAEAASEINAAKDPFSQSNLELVKVFARGALPAPNTDGGLWLKGLLVERRDADNFTYHYYLGQANGLESGEYEAIVSYDYLPNEARIKERGYEPEFSSHLYSAGEVDRFPRWRKTGVSTSSNTMILKALALAGPELQGPIQSYLVSNHTISIKYPNTGFRPTIYNATVVKVTDTTGKIVYVDASNKLVLKDYVPDWENLCHAPDVC